MCAARGVHAALGATHDALKRGGSSAWMDGLWRRRAAGCSTRAQGGSRARAPSALRCRPASPSGSEATSRDALLSRAPAAPSGGEPLNPGVPMSPWRESGSRAPYLRTASPFAAQHQERDGLHDDEARWPDGEAPSIRWRRSERPPRAFATRCPRAGQLSRAFMPATHHARRPAPRLLAAAW